MPPTKRLLPIVVMAVLSTSGVRAAGPADGAGAILDALKAKDNAFDNVILRFTEWGEEHREPWPYWKFPPRTPEEVEDAKDNRPRIVKFRFFEQMVVRGRDTTITGEEDPDLKQGAESRGWTNVPYHKRSETGGLVKTISDSKSTSEHDRTFEIRQNDAPVGIVGEERMAIAFVHGFGFGTRIKTIDSVVRADDRRILTGTIQIWWEDVSTFRIELGDDLLVKQAQIDCDVKGHQTRFKVTTEGAIERQGYVFARTGHFQRMTMAGNDAGQTAREPHVTEEFSARFDDARFHLSDEEYNTLTRMEMTPGTDVRDHVTNRKYRVEKDGTIKDQGVLFPRNP